MTQITLRTEWELTPAMAPLEPSGMWRISSFTLLMFAAVAVAQNTLPPEFSPYGIPEAVYPGAEVIFAVRADDESLVTYDLLSAPTNASSRLAFDRGQPVLAITWRPDESLVGTTNVFVVRATDEGVPPLSATNIVHIRVIEPPPIRSIALSNGIPVLAMSDLIPDRLYELQVTTSLGQTNWSFLTEFRPVTSAWTVQDLLAAGASSRFYRLRPSATDCYNGAICP